MILPRRHNSAFTLIEVLLAVGIFSIVLVAINTVFFAALRLRQHTSELVNESLPFNHALVLLRRDLQNAVPPGGLLAGDFRSGSSSGGSSASASRTSAWFLWAQYWLGRMK